MYRILVSDNLLILIRFEIIVVIINIGFYYLFLGVFNAAKRWMNVLLFFCAVFRVMILAARCKAWIESIAGFSACQLAAAR